MWVTHPTPTRNFFDEVLVGCDGIPRGYEEKCITESLRRAHVNAADLLTVMDCRSSTNTCEYRYDYVTVMTYGAIQKKGNNNWFVQMKLIQSPPKNIDDLNFRVTVGRSSI
jgi:hypothetical protein